MRHHRFYVGSKDRELRHDLWINDKRLLRQWLKVLRYREGDEVVLFDGVKHERLYRITQINPDAAHLAHITDLEPQRPVRKVHVFWSSLKKDKNDWVVQKCTELGVSNFTPIISGRTENKRVDTDRLKTIAIEAAEQCGRIDIPHIHEPMDVQQAVSSHSESTKLYFANMDGSEDSLREATDAGIFIGPEGGWNDEEIAHFVEQGMSGIKLGDMTLRAETAAIIASSKLL
ncbi:MAG: RsmE family RNA methyltransferase [Patescibacteria group bacterium]